MAKQQTPTLDERFTISNSLDKQMSFKAIGRLLDKDPTTIAKEVKSHFIVKQTGTFGRPYNACIHRKTCDQRLLCSSCNRKRPTHFCRFCKHCNYHCSDFKQEHCSNLLKPPYVCNGCPKAKNCTLEKHLYQGATAYNEYKEVLSESRSGITLSIQEIAHLDSFISPLIKKGQSLNHICANNKDSIMLSQRTHRLLDYNLFSARNIDLPRKVRYKARKKKLSIKWIVAAD